MSEVKKVIKKQVLPLLPLRGLTVFPYMILHFDVGRVKSIKALEEAMINNQLIFLVTQKDAKNDSPDTDDIYTIGTISKVKQLLKLPGDTIRVLVEGISRAEICEFTQIEPFFMAEVVEKIYLEEEDSSQTEIEALKRRVLSTFEEYSKLNNKVSPETVLSIMNIEDADQLADIITSNLMLKVEQKQEILNEFQTQIRLRKLLETLIKEIDIMQIERDINIKVRKQIDKSQKEYYLREQLKAIQNELGDKDGITGEVEEYKRKLEEGKFGEEIEKKVLKELDRLLKMPSGSAEGSVIRTYLDWIFDLPWNKQTEEIIDLDRAQEILDEDHYGLEKVKERIIEYLAIRKLKNDLKGPILCLAGPPGVGKTSIAKSIARALNRNYVRMSLGGVRDEAEIRGHRRTYVGAMPGRIISALKQAGSKNPLILLDEIDKMSSDFRGDPASAMLEVLDGEQNYAFRDHYLELPFDLSDVLFITTANNLDTVPRPLLDRMEVISLSSYTEEEKVQIATKYLFPKQIEAHGFKKSNLKIDESAVREIINCYTRESGVRGLERQIASVCRKVAKKLVSSNQKTVKITAGTVEKYLGTKRYRYDMANEKDEVGVATGLAWTPVGGDTLSIEVTLMEGKGSLELTGQLGDVMKESARAAMSYIRSKAELYGIDKDFYSKYDIHIHVPEGAIPKDGPSAGITLATAMVSALTGKPIRKNVAMTGEITLRGRVLPIGGVKEKVLAAHRAGIDTIIIPSDNKKDLDEIPENVRKTIKFVIAEDMETVLSTALAKSKPKNKQKIVSGEEKSAVPEVPPQLEDLDHETTAIEQ
ncbi:endopeptidase La [Acetivibrio mesophilus]|uniref:Lon protease n=1 Tax=Acetivibrio mesophilus TaxID=2487273 RepID=A0A4Q0I488_9FIRM|nr:endopeptidase La [Acetivibrio mesophilus]ODM26083.1 endopeptidase La [Clostridium sp. Bc-iso-3]RXE59051.1 endopeptidase La [Acetivibrio mesophilus]HHV28289.1 endopeptidase La [Clostridium sp.]